MDFTKNTHILKFINRVALPLFILPIFWACTGPINQRLENMDHHSERLANEVEHDREYLKTMTDQLKNMSSSLEEFQKLATELSKFIIQQMSATAPPGNTPDISEILDRK